MADEEHWMIHLQKVYYPVLAAIGIPSNILSFLIFWSRKCMFSKTGVLYLMAIAVADTAVLVFIVVLEISVKYHSANPFWFRQPWCSLRDVFTYGIYNVSTWLVVAFTADRFLAITTWRLKNCLCNPRSTLKVIVAIFVLGHLLALPHYWAYISVYKQDSQRWTCIYRPGAPIEYAYTLVSLQTALSHVLPYIAIGVLNGLTLRQISLSNRVHMASKTGGHKVPPLLLSRKRKSVVLLVTVSMTFVLLTVTRSVTQFILRTKGLDVDRNDYSLDINIAADIGTMLSLANAAVNMYLYACTQTKFRQEVVAGLKRTLWICGLGRTGTILCRSGHT